MLAAARTLRVAQGHLSRSARFAGRMKVAIAPGAFGEPVFRYFGKKVLRALAPASPKHRADERSEEATETP